jgi:hypothetical protein
VDPGLMYSDPARPGDDDLGDEPIGHSARTAWTWVTVLLALWLAGLGILVYKAQPSALGAESEPVHVAGPRRGPPHVVRASTRSGVWSELAVTDGQEGSYKGQFVHAVTGKLHVDNQTVCARPKLYLNGELFIRGYSRCGCGEISFIAWTSTRELPWYGPKGATFELVWTDPWSREHPRYKFQ